MFFFTINDLCISISFFIFIMIDFFPSFIIVLFFNYYLLYFSLMLSFFTLFHEYYKLSLLMLCLWITSPCLFCDNSCCDRYLLLLDPFYLVFDKCLWWLFSSSNLLFIYFVVSYSFLFLTESESVMYMLFALIIYWLYKASCISLIRQSAWSIW